jgi:uncharacterized membrane protein YcjF (UPF0283 family)
VKGAPSSRPADAKTPRRLEPEVLTAQANVGDQNVSIVNESVPNSADATEPAFIDSSSDSWIRAGDTGLGRPPNALVNASTLSPQRFHEALEHEDAWDDGSREPVAPLSLDWMHALRGSAVGIVFLAVFSIVALFVSAQITSTLASLAVLPGWARISGYAGLSLLSGVLLFTVIGLGWKYFRLRRNRQVALAGIQILEQRRATHSHARNAVDTAVGELRVYLREYDLEDKALRSSMLRLGFSSEELGELRRARSRLLDLDKIAGNHTWLGDYTSSFQAILDRTAKVRVDRFAKRAAVKTAISPNSLLDTLIVGYLCFAMLTDLCGIYRVRLGGVGTAMVLIHLFINVYLAGEINELEGGVSDTVQSLLHSSGELASFAVGKIAAKGASAILNYALLRRLGTSAIGLLRPVDPA